MSHYEASQAAPPCPSILLLSRPLELDFDENHLLSRSTMSWHYPLPGFLPFGYHQVFLRYRDDDATAFPLCKSRVPFFWVRRGYETRSTDHGSGRLAREAMRRTLRCKVTHDQRMTTLCSTLILAELDYGQVEADLKVLETEI